MKERECIQKKNSIHCIGLFCCCPMLLLFLLFVVFHYFIFPICFFILSNLRYFTLLWSYVCDCFYVLVQQVHHVYFCLCMLLENAAVAIRAGCVYKCARQRPMPTFSLLLNLTENASKLGRKRAIWQTNANV